MRQLRAVPRSWLARSDWPLVWGWNPDDRLRLPATCRTPFRNAKRIGGHDLTQCLKGVHGYETHCPYELCHLLGRWELREWNEVGYLRKAVNHCQNGCVTVQRTIHKVKGDMGPRAMLDWQWLQKTGWSLVGRLILGTGRDEGLGVDLHGRPPEKQTQEGQGVVYSRVPGEP